MALRSLNASAPERNKKGSVCTRKTRSMVSAPNDENVNLLGSPNSLLVAPARSAIPCKSAASPSPDIAPVPASDESAIAEIEYLLSENLTDLTDPEANLHTLIERLDSKDWLKVCEAVNNTRQLSIYHASSLQLLLEKVIPLLVKALKNPRSALCKTAIMGSADLFKAYPNEIINMLEQLLLQLLLKASQDKKFVCEEAERSLEVMTDCLSPSCLLIQLQPYVKHRSPRVRAKAASCVYRCVAKLGSDGIKKYGFQPLLQMAASHLNDQLPEAREAARKLIAEIYAVYPHNHVTVDDGNLEMNGNVNDKLNDEKLDIVQEVQTWSEFCTSQLSLHVAQAVIRLTSGA